MKKIKHSKYKNTGVLFELLVSTFYLSIEIPIDIAHIFLISITSLVVWPLIDIWIGRVCKVNKI